MSTETLRAIHGELVRVVYSAEENSVRLIVALPASEYFPARTITEIYAVVHGKLIWTRETP